MRRTWLHELGLLPDLSPLPRVFALDDIEEKESKEPPLVAQWFDTGSFSHFANKRWSGLSIENFHVCFQGCWLVFINRWHFLRAMFLFASFYLLWLCGSFFFFTLCLFLSFAVSREELIFTQRKEEVQPFKAHFRQIEIDTGPFCNQETSK